MPGLISKLWSYGKEYRDMIILYPIMKLWSKWRYLLEFMFCVWVMKNANFHCDCYECADTYVFLKIGISLIQGFIENYQLWRFALRPCCTPISADPELTLGGVGWESALFRVGVIRISELLFTWNGVPST